jgi:uncharacterized iron-regulated membrane protein
MSVPARSFRQSMSPLHTWAGVVFAGVLFVVFWTGTLLVFDRELDRWLQPSTRLPATLAQTHPGLDGPVLDAVQGLTAGAPSWLARLPTQRQPTVEVSWRPPGSDASVRRHLDPRTGALLADTGTAGASDFLFKLHYSLHLDGQRLGSWIVGAAGMAMVLLLVSGVFVHRRLIADFFLFRPGARLQRASLDLHNVTGVLLLPFHLLITLTGLAIFINTHWPTVYTGAYASAVDAKQAFFAEAYAHYKRPAAGRPATQALRLDPLLEAARQTWHDDVGFVRVWHPGDANGYVEVRRGHQRGITMRQDTLWFDAATGDVLHRHVSKPVMQAQRAIVGLHFLQFQHWTIRWLYFLAGLAGCLMIGTGLVVWLEARRERHARCGLRGVGVVEALAIAAVPGVMVATLALLLVNRVLPADPNWTSWDRAGLEKAGFFVAWLATLVHAALRGGWRPARASPAWREQCAIVGGLAVAVVAAHWLSTGQHLLRSAGDGQWGVAGVDLMLLLLAVTAFWTSRRIGRRADTTQPQSGSSAQASHA